jgi:hypothetical protein
MTRIHPTPILIQLLNLNLQSNKRLTGTGAIYGLDGSWLEACPTPISIPTKIQMHTTRATVILIESNPFPIDTPTKV